MHCTSCGNALDDTSGFCGKCGAPITPSGAPPPPPGTGPPPVVPGYAPVPAPQPHVAPGYAPVPIPQPSRGPRGPSQPHVRPEDVIANAPAQVVVSKSSKFHTFKLVLQPAQQAYFPGQPVCGRLILRPKDLLKCRGVKIRFRGRVHTEVDYTRTVTVGSGKNQRTETRHETARETVHLFHCQVQLWTGALQGNREVSLPFAFTLPNVALPSSFESRKAFVRYDIYSNVDCPFWTSLFDPNVTMPFTVLELIDINHPTLTPRSLTMEADKTLCCCCCASGPLTLRAHCDHRGYVAGEKAVVNIAGMNLTGKDMGAITVALHQTVWRRARSHTASNKFKYAKSTVVTSMPAIPEQAAVSDKSALLEHGDGADPEKRFAAVVIIPGVPPTLRSPTLDVRYFFKVTQKVPVGFDLAVTIPVIIGTMPRLHGDGPPTYDITAIPPPKYNPGWKEDQAPPAYSQGNWADPANVDAADNYVWAGLQPSAPPPPVNMSYSNAPVVGEGVGEGGGGAEAANGQEPPPYQPSYPLYDDSPLKDV